MKIRFYLAMAIVALSWMGCSQEEATNEIMSGANVIQATIESSSRSAVTDAGVFSWTTGDEISLLDANNKDTYTYSGTGNGFNPPASVNVSTPVVAYYPANENHNTTEFYLPDTYGNVNTEYVASTNAAMIATPPTTGNTTYAFMHLGGVMRFNVKNVPVDADGFKFSVIGKKITGAFEVNSGTTKTIATEDDPSSNNTVIIRFKKLTEAKDMTFYVPMPTGTYTDYIVGLHIDGQNEFNEHTSTNVTNTIARKTLLLMPTFTWNGQELEKGEATVGVIDLEDGSQSATITDDAEVVVTPGADADATATLNYAPANDGSSVLSISDGSGATESGESEGKVLVSTANGSTVASCDINTPSLTVELSAADGGTATFEEVTALTAEQTLIIGSGVTIETLILNGGALQVADGATIGEIIVKDAATLTAAIAAGGEVTLAADVTLTEMATISKDLVLDLGGYTLASSTAKPCLKNTATTTITNGKIVSNDVGVQNNGTLTINCDIESSSCAINNVYSGKVTIKGGSYSSTADAWALIVANGWGEGNPEVIIEDGTFTSSFTNLSFNNGSKGTINGGTFNCTGNWYNLYVGGDNGGCDVTYDVEECSFTSGNVNVYVEAGTNANKVNGIEYTETITTVFASTVEGLTQAIARGGNVTLAADITLTEMATIEKNLNLDLGGYTLASSTAKPCLKNTATTTITNGKIVSNDVGVQNNGTLTINCDIESSSCAINNVYSGKVTIKGGSYSSTADAWALIVANGWGEGNPEVIIEDGTFTSSFTNLSFNNGSKGTINGGTFNCTGNWYNLYVGGDNGGCNVTYDVEECSFTTAGTIKIYVEAGTNANTVNNTEYTETKVWSSTE